MGSGTSGSQTWVNGDFNYDGVVNADDFGLFMLGNAVQSSVLGAVPEPAVGLSLMLLLPVLMRRRK